MFCRKCGADNGDGTVACSECGALLGSVCPAPDKSPREISSYLLPSILVTIFCCIPFGIVAIVYASGVNGKLQAGNYQGALAASNKAKLWCWIAFAIGFACFAYKIVVLVSIATLGASIGE